MRAQTSGLTWWIRGSLALGASVPLLSAGCASAGRASAVSPRAVADFPTAYHTTVLSVVAQWLPSSQSLARQLIAVHGEPDEATPLRLIWHNRAPWKRIELLNMAIPHHFPAPHEDVLIQTIDYAVPPDRANDLLAYNGSLLIDRTRGELASRADSETTNFLTLNLANELITGARSVEEARVVHAQAIQQNQHPIYKQGLLFTPLRVTADLDQSLVPSPLAGTPAFPTPGTGQTPATGPSNAAAGWPARTPLIVPPGGTPPAPGPLGQTAPETSSGERLGSTPTDTEDRQL